MTQGIQGEHGDTGAAGVRGEQGIQGERGDTSTRVLVLPTTEKPWYLDVRYIVGAIVTTLVIGMVFAIYALNTANGNLAHALDQVAAQRDFLQETIDANSIELSCRAAAVAEVDSRVIDELNAVGDGTYIVVQGLAAFAAGDEAALEQTLVDAGVTKDSFATAKAALLGAQAARIAALQTCIPPTPTPTTKP